MVLLLLTVGCVKLPPTHHGPGYDGLRADVAQSGVEVLPPVLVEDLPAPPLPPLKPPGEIESRLRAGEEYLGEPTVLDPQNPEHAAFLRNDYVGAVRFGGGLIRTGETALETRARLLEFSAESELRAQSTAWLTQTVADVLSHAKVPALAPTPGEDVTVPAPGRVPIRGVNPLDGRDNLNLPRVAITPEPMAPAESGPRWRLVPYLRSYYVHNGGWFLGHEWGCSGGARVEVMLALYDRHSGQVVWWQTSTGRHVEEMKAQPSRSEMDQFLLWAEDQVEGELGKGFLR